MFTPNEIGITGQIDFMGNNPDSLPAKAGIVPQSPACPLRSRATSMPGCFPFTRTSKGERWASIKWTEQLDLSTLPPSFTSSSADFTPDFFECQELQKRTLRRYFKCCSTRCLSNLHAQRREQLFFKTSDRKCTQITSRMAPINTCVLVLDGIISTATQWLLHLICRRPLTIIRFSLSWCAEASHL